MKKYAFIFVVLIALGVSLGLFFHKKYQVFKSDSAVLVANYIQEIERQDEELNVQLMKLGFGLDNHYDKVVNKIHRLRESNRQLERILIDPESNLDDVATAYEEYKLQNSVKMGLVESFKTNNSALLNSANFSPYLGGILVKRLNEQDQKEEASFISEYNAELIQYIRKGDQNSKNLINAGIRSIRTLSEKSSPEVQEMLSQYIYHTQIVLKYLEPTKLYLAKTTEVETSSAIAKVSKVFQEKRAQHFDEFAQLRTATMGFGALMFLAFLVLLMKMRQLFSGEGSQAMMTLNQKIDKITDEIKGPLGFLSNNLNSIDSSFGAIKETTAGLDSVIDEIKKPNRDNAKVNEMMTKTLKDYHSLSSRGVFEKTHTMITGTTVGVDEISTLVAALRRESERDNEKPIIS